MRVRILVRVVSLPALYHRLTLSLMLEFIGSHSMLMLSLFSTILESNFGRERRDLCPFAYFYFTCILRPEAIQRLKIQKQLGKIVQIMLTTQTQ